MSIDFGVLTPEDFPRWRDRTCQHPDSRQEQDGQGTVCMDCGILQIIAW